MSRSYQKDNFIISTDPARLDIDVIHSYLSQSYWARGIPKEVVIKSIENSLCFGLFHQGKQIGFARVITDYTSHAYLCDVFVLEEYRGKGLGIWLVECVISYPSIQGVRRLLLATADAQEFYRKCGFESLNAPEQWMEKLYDRLWFKPEASS